MVQEELGAAEVSVVLSSGRRLSHLYMTVFLHNVAIFMVPPVITDVTVSALCPEGGGGGSACSLAIYLNGFQHLMAGLGTLVMMPVIGNLSDRYGRKALINLPLTLAIIPLGILAYSRERRFFYAFYVLSTLISMFTQGALHCLSLAYAADSVPVARRVSAFGILSGIGSCAHICGTLSTRFLPTTSSIFQVAAAVAVAAAFYMRVFLPADSAVDHDHHHLSTPIIAKETTVCEESAGMNRTLKTPPSLLHFLSLFRSISPVISQVAIVTFLTHLGDVALHAPLQYILKANFGFDKTQFSDLMLISSLTGTFSQLIVMPILAPALTEQRLLSLSLLFGLAQILLYSISWSSWVPYAAAMFSVFYVFSQPCIRSIVSKQFEFYEQGKAQGIISGVVSLANVLSPLAFSPLTALFLSDNAPFNFPGFSIICAGLPLMVAFVLTLMIRTSPIAVEMGSSPRCSEA